MVPRYDQQNPIRSPLRGHDTIQAMPGPVSQRVPKHGSLCEPRGRVIHAALSARAARVDMAGHDKCKSSAVVPGVYLPIP